MKANKVIMAAMATLLISSCSIYHPQAVDIPLINHSGDLRVDASVGASAWLILPDVITFGGTASYGFNQWLCGQVHANYGGENFYLQAAPGAYMSLGGHAVSELYIGYGYGGAWETSNTTTSDSENSGNSSTVGGHHYSGNFGLPFMQINVGWRNLGPVDIGVGIKTGIFMPDFEYHGYNSDGTENASRYEHYTTTNTLLEPQLQLGIGGEMIKFTLRFGYSWLSDLNQSSSKMHHDYLTLSTGLTFSF